MWAMEIAKTQAPRQVHSSSVGWADSPTVSLTTSNAMVGEYAHPTGGYFLLPRPVPGEGWGEGHFLEREKDPHPTLSRRTGRGKLMRYPNRQHRGSVHSLRLR